MNIVRLNPKVDDLQRRNLLFDGDFILYSQRKSLTDIVKYADSLITAAFGKDPEKAQYAMSVEEFVKIASKLKTEFTNSPTTKELIRGILTEFGIDLDNTYFDVPRLRIVTSDNFLTAGVGYAYKAHRDTWYSSPGSQINWWMPVYDNDKGNTMSMYPGYWSSPLKNSSEIFDYQEWCNEGRKQAVNIIDKDNRKHPLPTEPVQETTETRIVLASGEIMAFSAAHVHATAPNTAGKTRFSMDFRTIHMDDMKQGRGAQNIDNKATGTTVYDFLRAKDFKQITEEVLQS